MSGPGAALVAAHGGVNLRMSAAAPSRLVTHHFAIGLAAQ